MVHALAHQPVGVFSDHNAAVDEHPEGQQHAEHHHKIERIPQQINDGDREQQRKRNPEPDHQATPEAHRCHNQNHHECQSGQNVALQFPHLYRSKLRLIL